MSRSRMVGFVVVLVGLVTMIWAPGAWPIVGVLLVVAGLALVLREVVGEFRSSAPTPYSEMLWRRTAGGPRVGADTHEVRQRSSTAPDPSDEPAD